MTDDLDTSSKDKIGALMRGALGAVPFAGGLLGELVAVIIPGQRQDRIVTYIRELDVRVSTMEADVAKAALAASRENRPH